MLSPAIAGLFQGYHVVAQERQGFSGMTISFFVLLE
jgi:hypothetical protein